MKKKDLKDIKYGEVVMNTLTPGNYYFMADIQKLTGLNKKSVVTVVQALCKHNYLSDGYYENKKGQYCINKLAPKSFWAAPAGEDICHICLHPENKKGSLICSAGHWCTEHELPFCGPNGCARQHPDFWDEPE